MLVAAVMVAWLVFSVAACAVCWWRGFDRGWKACHRFMHARN